MVYEIIHSWSEIKTVGEFLIDADSPAFSYKDDVDGFLNVKDKNGRTNRKSIESSYTTADEVEQNKNKASKDLLLKVGVKLAIEEKKANKAGLLTQGIEVVSNDSAAFKAQMLADLESKDTYKNVKTFNPNLAQFGKTKVSYPDFTVWIWCRSLASVDNNYEGAIFNVTPFVSSVSTDVTKNGGNFQIQLAPLVCEMSENGKWIVRKNSIQYYTQKEYLNQQGIGYLAVNSLNKIDSEGTNVRNNFLFHNMIGSNDLVFIRFETLQLEAEQRIGDASSLTVPKSSLSGRIYDMIGLVDENGISVSPSNTDVDVTVSGRDLMKLFIEDGTYFFFLEVSQGMVNGPGGANGRSDLMKRLVADKALQYLNTFYNNSIERVFAFVMQQLSTIKVIPDTLLSSYQDRRNTRFNSPEDDKSYKPLDNQISAYEEQAINEIKRVRVLNQVNSISPERDSLAAQVIFRHMKTFLKEIRDKKVRKTSDNQTDGWFSFKTTNERNVIETIPEDTFPQYFNSQLYSVQETRVVFTDVSKLVEIIDNIIDIEQSKTQYKGQMRQETASGIWQIIKLVIDKTVANRRLIDSSLSSANGSLLNFLRKVCQDPFVEFYGDTYGDMYYLTARKPPYDQVGLLSLLKTQINTENGKEISGIIDIEAEDVLHESLSMSDAEVYSWYHLTPQANFYGGSDQFSLAYLPAVHFPEYAEIWGSKPLQLVHNYLPYIPVESGQNALDKIQEQAIADMKYLIDTSAYLPFTRQGSIKVKGDRRLKVGNICRYKPTGEIFFIDAVKNEGSISERSIERSTTINVSRGMVEQLIYGIPSITDTAQEATGIISYFNLINTQPNYDYVDSTQKKETKVKIGERNVQKTTAAYQDYKLNTIGYSSIRDSGNQNLHLLNDYPPTAKQRFTQLINVCNERGYKVIITSALRDRGEQLALWRKNKMNARPGMSQHENGSAIDINLVKGAQHLTKATSKSTWLASGIPEVAKLLHMKWGGDFGGNYDPVHFALVGESSATDTTTEDIYETRYEEVKGKSLDIAKIFSNFKVNKFVFDFFLRRQQFDEQYRSSNGRLLIQSNTGIVAEDTKPVIVRTIKKKNK